jgi:hypothetical protein
VWRSLSIDSDDSFFIQPRHARLGPEFSNVDISEAIRDIAAKLRGLIALYEIYLLWEAGAPTAEGGERGRGQRSKYNPQKIYLPRRNQVTPRRDSIDLLDL